MEDKSFREVGVVILLGLLLVLCFFILKPILISIIIGALLAFIFFPVYNWVYKKTNSKNFSAALICLLFAVALVCFVWFLTPIAIDQSMKIYLGAQQMNFAEVLKKISPSFFSSDDFSREVSSIMQSFIARTANSLSTSLSEILLDFPNLLLQAFVVILTFFYLLRDKDEFGEYVRSISPLSKEVNEKFLEYSKGITSSVLYGFVIVGVLQGLIVGVSLFIFNVPNAFLLTLIAILSSIIPILGPFLVWIPVAIYLFMAQNIFQAIGVAIFGAIASSVDNILRPLIVSRRTSLPVSLVFLGMIGGFLFFGILGFIVGPLLIAYLLIFLELYRSKKISN